MRVKFKTAVGYYSPTFKQIFPNWESFYKFLKDYAVYHNPGDYTSKNAMIYYSILYRQFANSNTAYDYEIFLQKLSLTIAENIKEFFKIRELIEYVNAADIKILLQGVESITNVGNNPNIETNKDTILNYIGTQSRTRSTENIVDRVYTAIGRLKINEIMNEVVRYEYLFVQIPPPNVYLYGEDLSDEIDISYDSDTEVDYEN